MVERFPERGRGRLMCASELLVDDMVRVRNVGSTIAEWEA